MSILVLDGQMACDIYDCTKIFDFPIQTGPDAPPPRKQLQEAAEERGWRQSVAGLVICPDCAAGPVGIVIPGWVDRLPMPRIHWQVEPLMYGATEDTAAIPAVVEDAA